MSSKSSQLVDHKEALSVYLKDMLLDPVETITELPQAVTTIEDIIEQIPAPTSDWRTTEFQALIFDVQGLKLAIPLHELNGILTWPDKALPKIPDKPAWYLGIYSQDHRHTQVVDTAHIVLPKNYHDETSQAKFIISVDDGNWGLACNKVDSVITLSPDQVRWRQQPGKRPWLAGTVLEKMCSILNIDELVKLL